MNRRGDLPLPQRDEAFEATQRDQRQFRRSKAGQPRRRASGHGFRSARSGCALLLSLGWIGPVAVADPGQPVVVQRALASEPIGKAAPTHESSEQQPRLFRAKLASRLILVPPAVDDQDVPASDADYVSSPSDRVLTQSRPMSSDRSTAAPTGDGAAGGNHLVPSRSQSAASRPWLDIRPRTLDDKPARIRKDELPDDVSGMADRPEVPQWFDTYAAELRPVDFCASSRVFHKPLYFEDRYLERLGVSRGLLGHVPPVRSGVHFMASAALLPLKVLHDPPHRCIGSPCTCQCRSLSNQRRTCAGE